MRFEALGPVRVLIDDGPIELRPAQRRLLASLLLDHGSWVTTDTLVDRMWGEAIPNTARSSLHVHLSAVRRQVPGVVNTGQGRYLLDLNGHQLDVQDFGALVTESVGQMNNGHFRDAADLASKAIAMWRGTPFHELEEVDASRGERVRLYELSTTASATLARSLMLQGRVSESIAHLRRTVEDNPFNEPMWEELIHAYYLAGRQVDALRAFKEAKTILGDELGLEPGPRLQNLEEKVLLQDPTLMTFATTIPNNLPEVDSSFIGREDDVDGVLDMLSRSHLVTITGAPGIGKSRLALEASVRGIEAFPGGVWLARLAGATSDTDTSATISSAMSVAEHIANLEDLYRYLSSRPALLILDNCEHLLPSVRRFLAPRAHGSRLRVLATSRVRLGVSEEVVRPLKQLPLPNTSEDLWDSPAVQLFADRVIAADPAISLHDADSQELLEVCRSTGGIPLALELAASWVPSIALNRVASLTLIPPAFRAESDPPHHSSVFEAVAWSVDLLEPGDQEAFVAASVFGSIFTADAFHRVCLPRATQQTASASIARLVEASLFTPERSQRGLLGYRILGPLRDFGASRLKPGRTRGLKDRHANWFVERARAAEASSRGPEQAAALTLVDETIADFRLAVRHLIDIGKPDLASEVVVGLHPFWVGRYQGWEGQSWLSECLASGLDDDHRGRALNAAGAVAFFIGDYERSVDFYQQLLKLAEASHDRRMEGLALYGMGRVELARRPSEGAALLGEAMLALQEIGDLVQVGECMLLLGIEEAQRGDTSAARANLTEAARIFEETDGPRAVSIQRHLSMVAWHEADEASARSCADHAVTLARDTNDRRVLTGALIQKALVEGRWGRPPRAATVSLEALNLVSGQRGVYFAQAAFGALPTLIGQKEWSLAARLLRHIEQVYREHGWAPLDVRSAAARQFRSEIEAGLQESGEEPDYEPVTSSDLFDELSDALEHIARAS
jgi:DNA-binding SARP family transcriptional activator/predicted ATPase